MVLVQEDELNEDHVIYYLSPNFTKTEAKYAHVDKLTLAVVQDIQHFCHYILLGKTIVISNCKPMDYILTRQLLGGKYSKWSSYRNSIWNSLNPNLRNNWNLLKYCVTFPVLKMKTWQRIIFPMNLSF